MRIVCVLIAAFALTVGLASADPIAYTINFTNPQNPDFSPNVAPDSGSFSYDPSTQLFSDFLIIWDGITFDFTAEANGTVTTETTDPQTGDSDCSIPGTMYVFDYLTQNNSALETAGCGLDYTWLASNTGVNGGDAFAFRDTAAYSAPTNEFGILLIQNLPGTSAVSPGNITEGAGSWTTQQSSTPEPASLSLLLCGGAFLLLKKKRLI